MVTASHNPADWNGMKLVREGSRPISGDPASTTSAPWPRAGSSRPWPGRERAAAVAPFGAYLDHLLGYVDVPGLRPLKVVVNAGNGGAGHVIDGLEPRLPFVFVKLQHEPDGTFPHGVPNPLLPENRRLDQRCRAGPGADLGIAWDGDFDRCFLFDERGEFIEGYYIVGLLAQAMLAGHPGARIIHDPRLTWNTIDVVRQHGGVPVQSKTGHAFIKERMRAEDAVYGGEMSAHHYFRDFAYCDSGMIPWLLVAGILSAGRQAAVHTGGGADRRLSLQRRDQSPGGGPGSRPCDRARALRTAGAVARRDRRRQLRVPGVAVQPAPVEYRAADPPERGEPGGCGVDGGEDGGVAGLY